MKHTVIQFIDADTFGGSEEVVMQLVAGLDRSRWRPVLFHHGTDGIRKVVKHVSDLGVECRTVPRISKSNVARTLPSLIRQMKAVQPSVVHVHLNWPLAARDAVIAARLAQIRALVATSHLYCPISKGTFGRLRQRVETMCVSRYIAVSDEIRERLSGDLQVPESKIRVVRNGIDTSRFDGPADPALRAALVEGSNRPVVFTPARLHTQKGHSYLLKAAALVPDALFLLAGDGPERGRLEEMARALGIQERVRFLGHREDIPQLLACSDLFVLPSLYEGLPISVLEAMAAGKPVIATAIGGTDEAIVHGETGFLIAPAEPASLAGAIRLLLSDGALADRLAAAAKARVKRDFSLEAMIQGVSQVYDELLQSSDEMSPTKDSMQALETQTRI